MSKPIALLYAIISVLLLSGISLAMSYQRGWLVLVFSIASVLFIAMGFIIKAKLRKHGSQLHQ